MMAVTAKAPARAAEPPWDAIVASAQFKSLTAAKKRFILPAFLFFLVYYFTLPLLAGYAPHLMSTPVLGPVTVAYLAALSQFVVGGTIAGLYVRAAGKHDRMAKAIIEAAEEGNRR
jgi:uncharacterized membrane protein (DUF485 family)